MFNVLKLSRKIVLLAVMLVGLSFAIFTDFGTNATGAAPCCSTCEQIELSCENLPPGPNQDKCYQRAFNCWRWCSFSC